MKNKNFNGKVYRIINLITNKPVYVGQTIQTIELRFNEHCSLSNNQNTSYLINTYGKQYFKIELIRDDINTKEELDILERDNIINYLQQYDLVNKIIYQNHEKQAISIQCIETQEIFLSMNEVAQKYNIHIDLISKAVKYGYEIEIDNKKLHWRALDNNIFYKKRIRDEYIIYIIEQKFESAENIKNIKDIGNATNTENIVNVENKIIQYEAKNINMPVYKKKKYVQCIETQEVFTSMNKAARKYNIHSNLINKSVKYGYAAGKDTNNNQLHWKQITNEQYAAVIIAEKNKEKKYIWKPIYIQQTWKKCLSTQLNFHKNNINSPLFKLLNKNDINNFRIIPVKESTLSIIQDNIKNFINIKSLNDAIEKEKQLISLLISNSYKLYNFYNNPNYSINDSTDETIVIDINEIIKNYQQKQKELEQKLLYNNQEINIDYKPMKIQCVETKEIFNDIYAVAKKYNIPMCNLNKAIIHGHSAGKNEQYKQLHWKEYNEIILNNDKNYQLYIIEQNIQNINIDINKNLIEIQCIETNEIFKDINQAAQKYNTTNILIYAAIRYGHAAGINQDGIKLHWVNINYPIYEIKGEKNIWIPICIVCERKLANTYKQNNIELLNKLKNDINCCIYNLLNQYPLKNFRIAKPNKYQFILNNDLIIKKEKKPYKIAIQCIETNEIFTSINQAFKKYKIDPYKIASYIQNNQPTGKDENNNELHWRFIKDELPQNNIYNYFINTFKNININSIFTQANINLSKYYNLYNQQLTSQSLISNKIFKNLDIIMWNLIKNNPYLDVSELCKSETDNIIFLNYISAAQYYNVFLQKIKNAINNTHEFIHNKIKQKIINIDVSNLKDNTIIYAISYHIIKIIINNTITYAITYNSFIKFKMQLENKDRANFGIGNAINNINNYQCEIIKSHIYFKEEADTLKHQLLGYKENVFRCKLPVKCITTNEEFSSIEEASKKYGYKSETNILYVCRGQREYTIDYKTKTKLKWKFLQEENYKHIKNKNERKYTVFLLYYNNDLILISKSTLFKNKQLSEMHRNQLLNKLKTNNTIFKTFCNNIRIDKLNFVIHCDNLSFSDAQKIIKDLKAKYISNGTLLNGLCK